MQRLATRLVILLITVTALAACAAPAATPALTGDSVRIENAWARPSPVANGNSAIYATLINPTGQADRLVAVKSLAGMAETHESIVEDGVVRMEPRPEGFELPPGGSVELAPGGKHIMLMGVADPLAPGDTLTATFVFEKLGEITLDVPVKEQP